MGMPTGKKCEFCTSATYYETIAGYNNHITTAHNKSGNDYIGDAYRCDKCGKYFDSCNALNNHTCP